MERRRGGVRPQGRFRAIVEYIATSSVSSASHQGSSSVANLGKLGATVMDRLAMPMPTHHVGGPDCSGSHTTHHVRPTLRFHTMVSVSPRPSLFGDDPSDRSEQAAQLAPKLRALAEHGIHFGTS